MSDERKAVFLSYASQDADAAKRICDALRQTGVEVWFDQSELVGGDAWDTKIRGQISSCGLFLPLISANTQARLEGYFRLEWKLAAQRTHTMADERTFLLPIVIDATRDVEAKVPAEFKAVQWTKLPGGETPPAFAARVKKLLEGEINSVGGALRPDSIGPSGHKAPPTKKWWWALPIFGVTMALLLVMKEGRKEPAPAAAPAISSVATEIARLRASLRPDEWTRADFDALVPTIDRMIQANPENGDAWALRGVANSLLVIRNLDSGTKPLEVGKEAADRALRLAPKSPLAELALGLHLTAMISRGSDVHAPRLHIERGLAGLPATEALSRYADVTSYWLGYQLAGADKTARAWLAAEPGASFPAWILAQSAVAGRRPAEAVKWAEQAAIDPDITGIRAFVTLFEARYYLQADLAAARAALDRVPGGQRGVHRVVATRFLVAMAEKHFDQALQELAQTPEAMLRDRVFHGPKALLAGFAHQAAGRTEVAQGFFRDSEKLLREELARDQDNFELRAVLALNLACLGRADEARRELAAVEPLLAGREPSVYTRQPVALIAQAHGVLGEIELMTPWLRRLITEPSGMPFTPASLRLDSRFGAYAADPRLQVLLAEFAGLDQPSVPPAGDDKSVAVLAFANLSDDKTNEYFSDGISEELLNVLAKIPDLKVTARTSSFHFKGTNTAIPEIASQLGVAYVVEGSVRKQGDKVRITAQLIKATDGFHVWSETFTRDLKDIFAVQDEIAGLIAKNLSLKLGTSGLVPTTAVNPQAFELYVQGRQAWNLRTPEGYARAESLLQQAVELEPGFARAHAALSDVWLIRGADLEAGGGTFAWRNSATVRRAQAQAEEAVALDPASAEALTSLSNAFYFGWKIEESVPLARRALVLNPNYATAHQWLGDSLVKLGWVDEGLAELARATELDPLSFIVWNDRGGALLAAGKAEAALAAFDRAQALSPDSVQSGRARALVRLGRVAEALQLAEASNDRWKDEDMWKIGVLRKAGRQADAEKMLAAADHGRKFWGLLTLGRTEAALTELSPLMFNAGSNELFAIMFDPVFDPIRSDPRFMQTLATLGLTEAHARAQAWRTAHPPETTPPR